MHTPPTVVLALTPASVRRSMLIVLAALAGLHLALVAIPRARATDRTFFGLTHLFDMGGEANIPTFWSSLVLLAAGVLAAVTARDVRQRGESFARHWLVLALGLTAMAVNEAAQVHDGVIGRVWAQRFGRGEGIFHYVWYIPVAPAALAVLLAYVPFLRRLERQLRWRLVMAASVYLGGAIGLEMVESYLTWSDRPRAIGFSQLVEEGCEIAGVTILVHALLAHIASRGTTVLARVEARAATG